MVDLTLRKNDILESPGDRIVGVIDLGIAIFPLYKSHYINIENFNGEVIWNLPKFTLWKSEGQKDINKVIQILNR